VQIVDFGNGEIRRSWQAHAEPISAIAASPNATLLATGAGYSDNEIKLWRPADASLAGSLRGHRAWITSLAFSPDGALLASGSADQTVRLWDMEKQELIAQLRGHLYEVWAVTFLPDGSRTRFGRGARPRGPAEGMGL
jgi:WD40 repeat protein